MNRFLSFGLLVLSLTASASAYAGNRVPVPFSDAYRDGYVLVLWSSYVDADLTKIVQRVRATGATHLSLPYFGCQSTIQSSDVGACQVGDTEQAIRAGKIAVQLGMEVTLLPIVATPQWDWRGEFDPSDVDGWFKSYETWLKGVAQVALSLGSKELIVGSEFSKLYQYEDRWSQLLRDMREVFPGPLIVTVNWDALDHSFWADADAIGVSSYHPLSSDDSPDQDSLTSAMSDVKGELMALSNKWNRPLYITEVGFPSTVGAARHPWLSDASEQVSPALQATCFSVFAGAWQDEKTLVRASIWATSDPGDPTASYNLETLGKPAESVIRSFFSRRAELK